MGQINNKNPKPHLNPAFGALNNRKNATATVGNNYRDRRNNINIEADVTANWFQRGLEKGLRYLEKGLQWSQNLLLDGNKKGHPLENMELFSRQTDRYEGVRNYSIPSQINRLEEGSKYLSKSQTPSQQEKDKYVGFLSSVIQYLDVKRKV